MPKITFVTSEGEEHIVDAEAETSLMNAAMDNSIPGIDADCGGEASCGTCHVMLDSNWADKVNGMSDMEESMLSMNYERQETSRLSCQVKVSDEHDGMRVLIPAHQM